jgi:hypothetical protein
MNIAGPIRTRPVKMTQGPMTEEVRESFERAEKYRAFLDANYADFMRLYPDEFIAIVNGVVVAHSKDFWEAGAALENNRSKNALSGFEFIRVNSPSLIL